MIALITIDIVLTISLCAYTHQIYQGRQQQVLIPPNQSIFINSSQNLQFPFSTQNFTLYKVDQKPHLTLQYQNYHMIRNLNLQEQTRIGVLQGLNQLYIKTNKDSIIEILLTNSKLDNVFQERKAYFYIQKDKEIFFEFTTASQDLFEFQIQSHQYNSIQSTVTTYFYDSDSNLVKFSKFKQLTKKIPISQQVVMELRDEFLPYASSNITEIENTAPFSHPVILQNTDKFNNIFIQSNSPSLMQKRGFRDLLALTVSFYLSTFFYYLLKKYNLSYS